MVSCRLTLIPTTTRTRIWIMNYGYSRSFYMSFQGLKDDEYEWWTKEVYLAWVRFMESDPCIAQVCLEVTLWSILLCHDDLGVLIMLMTYVDLDALIMPMTRLLSRRPIVSVLWCINYVYFLCWLTSILCSFWWFMSAIIFNTCLC